MKYSDFVATIDTASQELLGRAAAVVNQALVLRNWLVGAYIVEYQQAGKDRAKYGSRLLSRLADDLAKRGVKGCSQQMPERMRQFYRLYPQLRQPLLDGAGRDSGCDQRSTQTSSDGGDSVRRRDSQYQRSAKRTIPERPTGIWSKILISQPGTNSDSRVKDFNTAQRES
jgi:hypothetical protein